MKPSALLMVMFCWDKSYNELEILTELGPEMYGDNEDKSICKCLAYTASLSRVNLLLIN